MSERMIYVNGRLIPESQPAISVYDRGFMSGYGVFERTRTYYGKLFRLDEHLDRLYRSMKMTRIDSGLSKDEMRDATLELVEINNKLRGPEDDYSCGHYITKGTESAGPTVVIFCDPIPFKSFASEYRTGAHAVSSSIRQVPSQVIDPKLKTTSRMYHLLAENEAKLVDPKAYPLMLDLEGNVCEVTQGNFWIVENGTLITPPGTDMLRGVTREAILELAGALEIPVRETNIQLYDVMNADEALISVTSRCVLPVTRVNGSTVGDGKPGEVFQRLANGWSERYGWDFVKQALAHLEPEKSEKASEPVAV
jgi:branched-chain amino acid aminotransferase